MESDDDDAIAVEQPAPPNWTKKLIPKKGGRPKKNVIIFTSPTGEEITSRTQLQQYLKSHPGGPLVSEFNWGTSETLRRSVRIVEKSKTAPTTEKEPPKKRGRKSSGKNEKKEVLEETETVDEATHLEVNNPLDDKGQETEIVNTSNCMEIDNSTNNKGPETVEVEEGNENLEKIEIVNEANHLQIDKSLENKGPEAVEVEEGDGNTNLVKKKEEPLVSKKDFMMVNQDDQKDKIRVDGKEENVTAPVHGKEETVAAPVHGKEETVTAPVDDKEEIKNAEEPVQHEGIVDTEQEDFKEPCVYIEGTETEKKKLEDEKDGGAIQEVKQVNVVEAQIPESGVSPHELTSNDLNERTKSQNILLNAEVSKKQLDD